jgi:enoyl-CoA hydratase/carnithine racemase
MKELNSALLSFSSTPEIGAVVLTGSEKAFAGMPYLRREC